MNKFLQPEEISEKYGVIGDDEIEEIHEELQENIQGV